MILIHGGGTERGRRTARTKAPDFTTLGEVAAGIAHDLNNRLSVILGQAQLLRRTAGIDPNVDRKLERIETEVLRASTMTRGMLEHARREPNLEPLPINGVIARALQILQPKVIGRAIELRADLSEVAPVIMGDAEQLLQAVAHVIGNAIDAMGERGTLTIATDVTDDALTLSVSDTGVGMDEQHAARIFEPFYTTKAVDGCAGLGLYLTLTILKAHGGSIAVETAPARGTTMRIRLPRACDPSPRLVVVK